MKTLKIEEVGIDEVGRLYIKPTLIVASESAAFQYIYRAAMGIYWDEKGYYFHSSGPLNQNLTYEKLFNQISQAVKEELGYSLEISSETIWTRISREFGPQVK